MNCTWRLALSAMAILAGSAAFADTLTIGGTGVALGGMTKLGEAFEELYPETDVRILPSLGSSGGVKALLAGAIDLGVTSRDLKDTEQAAGASARLYAYTPLAVVTSTGTDVDGVTTQDMEAIYSGTMTHWPDGTTVRVIMRPASETDTQVLRTLSDKMARAVDEALERPGLVSATDDQENAETLERVPGSIGLVALGQIATEHRRLKVLTLDGVMPTVDQGFDPKPMFAKSLYVVSKDEMSPLAHEFAKFVFSDQGRGILSTYDHSPAE